MDKLITIYHGSEKIIEHPTFGVGKQNNDFGLGFYCTASEDVDAKMKEYFPETNLKRIRTVYGCTQAELSAYSGVSLRSIQMYEQRNKNINKASADTVYSLA